MRPFEAHALELVQRNFAVFPLVPGRKVPFAGSRGHLNATKDPLVVAEWARREPRANIGIRPDPGVIVIDIDDPAAAHAWRLERGLPKLRTRTVRTRKGYHLYVKADPGDRRWRSRHPWGDVKTDRGFCLGPGSVAGGHEYRLMRDLPMAPLPMAWVDALVWPARSPVQGGFPANANVDVDGPISAQAFGLVRILGTLREGDGRRSRYMRYVGLAYRVHGGNRALLRALREVAERIGLEPADLDGIDSYLSNQYGAGQ